LKDPLVPGIEEVYIENRPQYNANAHFYTEKYANPRDLDEDMTAQLCKSSSQHPPAFN
jgi:hypothetical protein